jgi:hypothetical protein
MAGAPTRGVASPAGAPILSVQGDHFEVDGAARFLFLVSFFDGVREARLAPARLESDLDYIQTAIKADGIRVFPNWWRYSADGDLNPTLLGPGDDTLFDPSSPDAPLRPATLAALKRLIAAAGERGLVVDVTFTRETLPAPGMTVAQYQAALVASAAALRDCRNVLFDIQNEFNADVTHRLTAAQVQTAIAAVTAPAGDPRRIVTASVTADSPTEAGRVAAETGQRVAAYHDPRDRDRWYRASTLTEIVTGMRAGMGDRRVPIYLQEPTGYGSRGDDDTTAAHFRDAAVAAKAAGAAAWTFHQRVGFNLQSRSFASRLGDVSDLDNAMRSIRALIDATTWGVARPTRRTSTTSTDVASSRGTGRFERSTADITRRRAVVARGHSA